MTNVLADRLLQTEEQIKSFLENLPNPKPSKTKVSFDRTGFLQNGGYLVDIYLKMVKPNLSQPIPERNVVELYLVD